MWLLSFFIGIITWTFFEYVLHCFLGHEHKGKNFFKSEHQVHHSKANYFAPYYKKIIAAIAVSVVVFSILVLFLSIINSVAFIAGLIGMYSLYEMHIIVITVQIH